jgi:VanZ family protein
MMKYAVVLARAAGVIGVLAIVGLSLVPGSHRPHTWLPGKAEHFIAYLGTASALALGFHAASSRLAAALGLALLAGAMEYLQHSVPGRHAAVLDAFASASGGVVGIAIGAVLYAFAARAQKSARAPGPG